MKMLPFHAWGVMPTWVEISPTLSFTPSNIPDRLLIMPLTKISLSHSVMASHRKSIEVSPSFQRPSRLGWEGQR